MAVALALLIYRGARGKGREQIGEIRLVLILILNLPLRLELESLSFKWRNLGWLGGDQVEGRTKLTLIACPVVP